jgi:hypothetical protein
LQASKNQQNNNILTFVCSGRFNLTPSSSVSSDSQVEDEICRERYEKIIIVRKYFLMGNQNSANIGAEEEEKRKLSEFNMKHVMP